MTGDTPSLHSRSAKIEELKIIVEKNGNFITKSQYFKSACKEVFRCVDTDQSNSVDVKEVYIAVLMLYLKLGAYVKGLTPPTENFICALMEKVGGSGPGPGPVKLDLNQFTDLCVILLEGLFSRIMLQTCFVMFIFPILASYLVSFYCKCYPHRFIDMIPPGLVVSGVACTVSVIFMPTILKTVDKFVEKEL